MKLLVFSKYYWPEGGGAELATHLIMNMLSDDIDIVIVSGTSPTRASFPSRISKYIHWEALRQPFKPPELLHLALNSAIHSLIEEADAIYVYSPLPAAIVARRINPDARVIIHLHNYQPISYTSIVFNDERGGGDLARSLRFELLEKRNPCRAFFSAVLSMTNFVNTLALRYADRIICVSNKQAEILARRVGQIRGKLRVIYNPLPCIQENERTPSEKPVMLYLGGESYIKGFHILLGALSQLKSQLNSSTPRVICAGTFNTSEKPNSDYSSLEIVGRVNHNDIQRFCCKSCAVLVPSIVEEAMPYAVVEAMAAGTIPIASRIGGVSEIVERSYAEKTLFTPGDSCELAERMKEVLSLSNEELCEIGKQLRNSISQKCKAETLRRSWLEVLLS